jgi:hypothetical protein
MQSRIWTENITIQQKMIRQLFCILFWIMLVQQLFSQSQNALISGGMSHTMYLCDNGKVFTWGDNTFGQLGRNEEMGNDINPVAIPTLTNIIAISGGKGYFSLAVRKDSTLWSWGQNTQLQLGTDTFCTTPTLCDYSTTPVQVKGGETGSYFLKKVIACSSGLTQSYALLSTGEVVAWGDNYHGQLGNGNNSRQKFPVYVKTSATTYLSNIKSISAGALFCYALAKDGKVWAWGKNSEFELACGNNQIQYYATPVLDINGNQLSNIISISSGYKHTLCLSSSGLVFGCGAFKGETWLNGTTFYTVKSYAVQYPSITNAVMISAGFTHSLAAIMTTNGISTVSWGDNKNFPISSNNLGGQLGIGDESITHTTTPQQMISSIAESIDSVKWIVATNSNSFIFSKNNKTGSTTLYGSGINDAGQLGTRDHVDRYSTVKIAIPRCNSNCPTAFLGDNKFLCTPIYDTLKSSYEGSLFRFRWFKDNILLSSENKWNLAITSEGKYTIEITDTIKGCDAVADEIAIKQTKPDFTIIYPSYCGDSVTFKLFNNQNCNWYSKKIFGDYLGSGSTITVPTAKLPTLLPDSSKTIWMFTQQCQPMQVIAKKNCNSCTIVHPSVNYTSNNCLFSNIAVSAIGSNIHWYYNGSNTIYSISNDLNIDSSITATYSFSVTQSNTICESQPTKVHFSVAKCIKTYSLNGKLIPALKGQITIYDMNAFPNIIDQETTNNDGTFRFDIPENANILILGKVLNTTLYEPTYFGNTTELTKAFPLLVDANIGDANISLNAVTKSPEMNREISIYPTKVTCFCIINISHNKPIKIELFNSLGNGIKSFYTNEESNYINTTNFPAGIYFVKVTSDSETFETKSFIKD